MRLVISLSLKLTLLTPVGCQRGRIIILGIRVCETGQGSPILVQSIILSTRPVFADFGYTGNSTT